MKYTLITLLFFNTLACGDFLPSPKNAAPAPVELNPTKKEKKVFNKLCPGQKGCEALLHEMQACKKTPGRACARFVNAYKTLLPEYDCQRPEDATPQKDYTVPAIWLCGTIHERSLDFLSKLETPRARSLFRSSQLQNTLDGALAEQYKIK